MQYKFKTDKESLVKHFILIDGISRTGKFLLGKIVSGFTDTEFFQYVSMIEHLPYLHRLGQLSEEAAIAMLKVNVDEHAYNMRIGRNLNLRYYDASSLYNSNEIDEYLKRSLTKNIDNIVESFHHTNRSSVFITHETLPNIHILFKAYPSIKIIHLIRHPIDLIHSWYLRGWGHRFGGDPLSFIPVLKGKNEGIPWFAYQWQESYESLSTMDRIIKNIHSVTEMSRETYNQLSANQKNQIVMIQYEKLVEQSNETIEKIASFLNVNISDRMQSILAREKCPSKLEIEKRLKKKHEILALASSMGTHQLMDMTTNYEQIESESNYYE